MKKRGICLTILLAILVSGCTVLPPHSDVSDESLQERTDQETEDRIDSELDKAETVKSGSENLVNCDNYEFIAYSDYSEGYAMVQYNDPDQYRCVSYLDLEGVIRPFKHAEQHYSSEVINDDGWYENFYEGYSYIWSGNELLGVDNDLNAWSYTIEENEKIWAFGGKYVLTERDDSGFSSSSKTLSIYELNQSQVELKAEYTFDLNDHWITNCMYLGNGIFKLKGNQLTGLMDINNGFTKCYLEQVLADNRFAENADLVVTGTSTSRESTVIYYVTKEGEMKEASLEMGCSVSNCNADGWILCKVTPSVTEPDLSYVSFNLKTGETHFLDKGVNFGGESHLTEFSKDNLVTISILGADRNAYTGVFDTDLKMITEPVLGESEFGLHEGLFITEDDKRFTIADKSGNILFESDLYCWMAPFHEGASAASEYDDEFSDTHRYVTSSIYNRLTSSEVIYLKSDGSRLFEKVRIQGASD